MRHLRLLAVVLGLASAGSAAAEDWPRFRGPNGSGVSDAANLPVDLAPDAAAWVTDVVFGRSSPIVSGGIVYLTGIDGEQLTTLAYDAASGRELWRRAVPRLRVDHISEESGPSVATPVSDGGHVYSFFPEFGLVSYDAEGAERWRLELPPFSSYYGLASSPILEGGVLVLLCDQTGEPYILGVEAATGRELWRQARDVRAESWTTPVVHRAGTTQARILTFGSFVIDAYDPRDGRHVWRLPGLGVTPVSSPIISGDRLFAVAPDQQELAPLPKLESFEGMDQDADARLSRKEMEGSPWVTVFDWFDLNHDDAAGLDEIGQQLDLLASEDFGLVAVDLSAGSPSIVWRQRKTLPYIATPILYEGVLFLVKDGGILTSYDSESGEVLKRGRIEGAVDPFSPSPVAAGGKLYLASSSGTVAVVSAVADWDTLAVHDLDEQIFASPAVADGRLFVRTRSKLYAFGG